MSFPDAHGRACDIPTLIQQPRPPTNVMQMEYDDDDEVKVLPCNHFFHTECVSKWLKVQNTASNTCAARHYSIVDTSCTGIPDLAVSAVHQTISPCISCLKAYPSMLGPPHPSRTPTSQVRATCPLCRFNFKPPPEKPAPPMVTIAIVLTPSPQTPGYTRASLRVHVDCAQIREP
jgi:hypothetical protein